MLEGERLVDCVRARATSVGLTFVAAVPLRFLDDDRFDEWLARGYAGEMDWMGRWRDQRARPAAHFRPYVSLISFAAPHDDVAPSASPGVGNIARYALGDDYHKVLKRKLFTIMDALRAEDEGLEARAVVDTAPVMEKPAAARAGLGWQGKHTNLIREGAGSWFLLGEILVNREVPTPTAAKDRCGICTDCISACPTGAIVAPYRLDARRCISYLTIELRGAIPRRFRSSIGNRIFGCDDCQEVCPWNRMARLEPLREFRARPGLRDTSLEEWLAMDLDRWRAVFRKSAVKRARFDGFKRNVAVALGNAADPASVPALRRALVRESALVRRHVAWALGQIDCPAARDALTQASRTEANDEVIEEIDAALRQSSGGG